MLPLPFPQAVAATEELRQELNFDSRMRRLPEMVLNDWQREALNASFKGELSTLQRLLPAHPECFEARDRTGKSLVHEAVRGKAVDTLAWLLFEGGASPHEADFLGRTPLHIGVLVFARTLDDLVPTGATELPPLERNKMMSVISLLLADAQVHVDAKDERGRTALAIASRANLLPAVVLLLAHKANPNLASAGGRTPLHFACANGHKSVAEVLLDAGAKIETPDDQFASLAFFMNAYTLFLVGITRRTTRRPRTVSSS